MTVHAAKGLEYDAVFIVGLEENLFPSDMSGDDERQIEEERRLLYVAMTRARKYLTLLFATTRFKYGSVDFCTPSRFLKDIDSRYLNMPSEGIKASWTGRSGLSMFDEDSKPIFTRREQSSRPFGASSVSSTRTFERKPSFEPKGNVPNDSIKKPWQKGKFQVMTESMLKNSAPSSDSVLHEGNVIEHERFGIGSVLSVEGSGDNTKARIKFLNVGEKTLLLKFARYKILK